MARDAIRVKVGREGIALQIGLESYTFAFSAGLGWQHLRRELKPLGFSELLAVAADAGLSGLSFPIEHFMPSVLTGDRDLPKQVRAAAARRGLFLNAATGGTDPDRLRPIIEAAAALGCTVVRTVIGGAKIGGDRREMRGQWQAFMERTLADLQRLAKVAERCRVSLALENHQDLTSDELIGLLRSVSSPALGILLDAANPLGTAEEPGTFYRKVMPYVKGVHLKDYTIHPTASGYLLARCPLGQGVVPFPDLFQELRRWHPDLRLTIELAALEARHIRVLEGDFWPEYPPRFAAELADLWQFINRHAAPSDMDWRTPVERGEDETAVAAYEMAQFEASVQYIQRIVSSIERGASA